jgi:hypothetical protein
MLVKQEIPDGDFCGVYTRECGRNSMCVFIDQGMNGDRCAFVCRRHKNITLGIERNNVSYDQTIVKCRACMKESGDTACT